MHTWPSKWMKSAEVKINAQQAFHLESNPKRQIAVILITHLLALSLVFLRNKIKLLNYFNDACEEQHVDVSV